MDEKIFYITKEKLKELKKEYENLIVLENKKVMGEAPKLLESEDLNPDFVNFQNDVNFMRARIADLKNILENYELIKKPSKDKQGVVGMGAKVKVDIDGQKDEFIIVGTLEANPVLGKISNESPVGRALLGKKTGEVIVVSSPIKTVYKIKSIKYETV